MKKLMVMAAMLALMLTASAPAFASEAGAIGGDVEFVDSDQARLSLTIQENEDNDQDLAGVAQSLSVDQNQVLAADDSTATGGDVSFD